MLMRHMYSPTMRLRILGVCTVCCWPRTIINAHFSLCMLCAVFLLHDIHCRCFLHCCYSVSFGCFLGSTVHLAYGTAAVLGALTHVINVEYVNYNRTSITQSQASTCNAPATGLHAWSQTMYLTHSVKPITQQSSHMCNMHGIEDT